MLTVGRARHGSWPQRQAARAGARSACRRVGAARRNAPASAATARHRPDHRRAGARPVGRAGAAHPLVAPLRHLAPNAASSGARPRRAATPATRRGRRDASRRDRARRDAAAAPRAGRGGTRGSRMLGVEHLRVRQRLRRRPSRTRASALSRRRARRRAARSAAGRRRVRRVVLRRATPCTRLRARPQVEDADFVASLRRLQLAPRLDDAPGCRARRVERRASRGEHVRPGRRARRARAAMSAR